MSDEDPTHFAQLDPSRFLSADQLLGRKWTLTITRVSKEFFEEEKDGKKIVKACGLVHFKETPKLLRLNRTNGLHMQAMFGNELPVWRGKRVTIWPTTDRFGRETVACIRIWGSPDLPHDLDVTIKLAKKSPKTTTMRKLVDGKSDTGAQRQPAANEPPEPGSNG